jgi:hypothetical protein
MTIVDRTADKVHEGKDAVKETKLFFDLGIVARKYIKQKENLSKQLVEIYNEYAKAKEDELTLVSKQIAGIEQESGDLPAKIKHKSTLALLISKKGILEAALKKELINVGRTVYQERNNIEQLGDEIVSICIEIDRIKQAKEKRIEIARKLIEKEREEAAALNEKLNKEQNERKVIEDAKYEGIYLPRHLYDELPAMVRNELRGMGANRQQEFLEEYERKAKSVGVAYLLIFLVGWHYAYLRKWGVQVLLWISLLAFGLGVIWLFVDLFRLYGLVKDYNKDVAIEVLRNQKAVSSS